MAQNRIKFMKATVLVLVALAFAGMAHADSTVRVQKNDPNPVQFIPDYTYTPTGNVYFTCIDVLTKKPIFSNVPITTSSPSASYTVTNPGSLTGTLYTYTCYLTDSPDIPWNIMQSNTQTATVIVHDCSVQKGYTWRDITNPDGTTGNCVQTFNTCNQDQICFNNGQNNLVSCISALSSACCAANSNADYIHREGVTTY